MTSGTFTEHTVAISALDNFQIIGTLFEPALSSAGNIAVVFAPGGGVAAVRYRHFARFLAQSGFPVLTYDYRGIGRSRPPSLTRFAATVEDWAEYDCGGAIRWMRERYPSARLVGMTHSIGALLLGAAPNSNECASFVFVCSHTGYFGDYRFRHRLPMAMLWHVVMPIIAKIVGYFPARRLGLGDDIPLRVALQWAARRTPTIEVTDNRANKGFARCRSLHRDTLVINITDDAYATVRGTRRLLGYFPELKVQSVRISPQDVQLARIGHFGFFRPAAKAKLWPAVVARILLDLRSGLTKAAI